MRVAVLVDPNYPTAQSFVSDVQAAASSIRKQIEVLEAPTGRDIDTAFARLAQKPIDALLVAPSPFLNNRRIQLVTLATYHRVPAIYPWREAAEVGGLMSYGASITDAYRQAGVYTGRILKGEKPADLPVMQSIKFEFVINLNTAKAFGLSFPPGLLAIADEGIRWSAGDPERARRYAAELVALVPDVILAHGSLTTGPLLQATRAVPIVFVQIADPVGAGFVDSLARPGGNATGFSSFEYAIAGKWLELLKEIAPGVKRAAVLRTLATAAGPGQFGAIQAVAPSLGVEVSPINVRDAGEVERAITAFARSANGGLIVVAAAANNYRKLVVTLAARHRLPAVYPDDVFVTDGGLIAYGPDRADQFRRAAGYVDRILKGEKPADLPVQAPTKYQLVINLKTAKALGIEMPASVRARADEVIE